MSKPRVGKKEQTQEATSTGKLSTGDEARKILRVIMPLKLSSSVKCQMVHMSPWLSHLESAEQAVLTRGGKPFDSGLAGRQNGRSQACCKEGRDRLSR